RMNGSIIARASGSDATMECRLVRRMSERAFSAIRVRAYSATNNAPAGSAGKMYPGNFDLDIEKKITGMRIQITRNMFSDSVLDMARRCHHARAASIAAATTNIVHGIKASSRTGTKYQSGSVW